MGHDRRSYGTVLLADHQFTISHDLVEHPALGLDDTKVGTAVRILHFVRGVCCYTCAYRKSTATFLLLHVVPPSLTRMRRPGLSSSMQEIRI